MKIHNYYKYNLIRNLKEKKFGVLYNYRLLKNKFYKYKLENKTLHYYFKPNHVLKKDDKFYDDFKNIKFNSKKNNNFKQNQQNNLKKKNNNFKKPQTSAEVVKRNFLKGKKKLEELKKNNNITTKIKKKKKKKKKNNKYKNYLL